MPSTHKNSMYREMAIERLQAMRKLEKSSRYRKHSRASEENLSKIPPVSAQYYLQWRSAMVAWCYQITATCGFSAESVEVATSIVDRYAVARPIITSHARKYQIAFITSLYMAFKVHEHKCLTLGHLQTLSQDRFQAFELEATEIEILRALDWAVNPPTAVAFLRSFWELSSKSTDDEKMQRDILEAAESHIHLAVGDELYSQVPASSLALASLCLSWQCVAGYYPKQSVTKILAMVSNCQINLSVCEEHAAVQEQLQRMAVTSLNCGTLTNSVMVNAYQDEASATSTKITGARKRGMEYHSDKSHRSPRDVVAETVASASHKFQRYVSVLI